MLFMPPTYELPILHPMQTMSIKRKMSIAAIVVASFIGGVFMTTMGANLLGIGHLAGTESRAAFDGFDGSTYVDVARSEEHTSELQSRGHLVCRLLSEKRKNRFV